MAASEKSTVNTSISTSKSSKDDIDLVDSQVPEERYNLFQAVRRWPWVAFYAVCLSSTSLLYGFDLVIVGTVSSMPYFQSIFGAPDPFDASEWIIPSSWLAIWNVSGPLGLMIGSVIGGWSQDRIGRKWTLAAGSLLSAAAVGICYIADIATSTDGKRGVFFIGKLIQGISIGAVMCTTQTYLSEVVPTTMRAGVMALFPIFKLLGQLAGSAVVRTQIDVLSASSYRLCFASQWPFSFVPFVLAFLLPESPIWLLRKGKSSEACHTHKRLEASKRYPDTDPSFRKLCLTNIHEQTEGSQTRSTYMQCFRGTNLRRTLLVCYANLVPQFFGFTLLGSASYFLQTMGMSPELSITLLIVGIGLGLASNICTFYTLSRFGRRPLSLITLAGAAMLYAGMGIAGFWSGDIVMWYTAATLMGVITTVGIGVWPASFAIGAETSSLNLRAKTQGIGWTVNGAGTLVFAIVSPYIYNTDAGNLGAKTGWVFAATSAAAWVIAWIWLPEMKDRSTIDIDMMFEEKVKAKDFKKWNNTGDLERA